MVCTIVGSFSCPEEPPSTPGCPSGRGASPWATSHLSSEYATSRTVPRHTPQYPHWATPHPALSYATPSTDQRHTRLLSRHIMNWATSHPAPSYATPSTELRHNPHWAASHPAYSCNILHWATPHPVLSLAPARIELIFRQKNCSLLIWRIR